MRFVFLILLQISLFATDFDCIIVGTSPFSLLEALYQYHSGKSVLILEDADECGGAWKSIEICGVHHADLGCHQIGNDMALKSFLEEYVGCKIVSMDNPMIPFEKGSSTNGWYFSQGCFELIDHLLRLIDVTDIALYTNSKVENVSVNAAQKMATVQTRDRSYTTAKLIVTPMSCLLLQPTTSPQAYKKNKYYHLYLLIQDPTDPRFTYQTGTTGVSRIMNLTHFVGLAGTGRQLIILQTHDETYLANGQTYLDTLKSKQLVDPSAYILKAEPYIYETGVFHQDLIRQIGAEEVIEVLKTGHFQGMSSYIPKWKQVLKPYWQNFK